MSMDEVQDDNDKETKETAPAPVVVEKKTSDERSENEDRDNDSGRGYSDRGDSDRGHSDRNDDKPPRRKSDSYGEAVLCRPLEVVVRDDRVERAIRQLKNRLAREGVLRELKNRRHYFKPSELKRVKRREAERRRRKQARQRNAKK